MSDDHYSYSVYRDKQTAEQFEGDRFGGPVGEYLRESQERYIIKRLAPLENKYILDVGGGTGRLSHPLARNRARVVLLDSSFEMLGIAGAKSKDGKFNLWRVQGDAHNLPVKTVSMDAIVMIRVLMHVINWKQVLAECCRISKDLLIIDFARKNSFATLESIVRKLQSRFTNKVQAYRTLSYKEIKDTLAEHGFAATIMDPGYFLPLKFYRILRSKSIISGCEYVFKLLGLSKLFGSPVTIIAERKS